MSDTSVRHFPIVNINGTSKRELLQQLEAAVAALRNAQSAMQTAAPHPRDFQMNSADYAPALMDHRIRMRFVDRLISDYCEIAQHLYNQGK